MALVLVILPDGLVFYEFNLSSLLFLLCIIDTTMGLAQKSAGKKRGKQTLGQLRD